MRINMEISNSQKEELKEYFDDVEHKTWLNESNFKKIFKSMSTDLIDVFKGICLESNIDVEPYLDDEATEFLYNYEDIINSLEIAYFEIDNLTVDGNDTAVGDDDKVLNIVDSFTGSELYINKFNLGDGVDLLMFISDNDPRFGNLLDFLYVNNGFVSYSQDGDDGDGFIWLSNDLSNGMSYPVINRSKVDLKLLSEAWKEFYLDEYIKSKVYDILKEKIEC